MAKQIKSANGMRVDRGMREHMAALVSGKRSMWAGSTEDDCIAAGLLLRAFDPDLRVTDEGRAIGEAEIERADAAKARSRANARARSDGMRSIGMVRTRSGGWE
jgi:hypothetical protein